jgi:sugar phosphate isomerase/epimerase
MSMERRTFLTALLALASAERLLAGQGAGDTRFGLCTFSCHHLWQAVSARSAEVPFHDAGGFLEYARALGGDGVQTPLRADTPQEAEAQVQQLRRLLEQPRAYYEAELQLPATNDGLAAFEDQVALARAAGAKVARTVLLSGRRYEVFHSFEDFTIALNRARRSLEMAKPILEDHELRLAIENHKDLTLDEFLGLLRECDSPWIGALVDTGNSMALLEEPHEVVERLSPYAFSVHFKDMAVQSCPDGILLSEVPLGTGCLDLPRLIGALRSANPQLVFNLEMATRDPLVIPCLTDRYWASFEIGRREQLLPAAMAHVAANRPREPVPRVAGRPSDEVLQLEEQLNRRGLRWLSETFAT